MRLLLVEDHPELAHWLKKALSEVGFAVDLVGDGVAADQLLQQEAYTLVVLDVSLPRLDGLALLARLRKRGQNLPVLLLTARAEVADRVKGLNLGADDYLTKPFELAELEARLRALLRRSQGQIQEVQRLGALSWHDEGYFLLQEKPLALTPREQAVLHTLMQRRGRPVSRQYLYEQVFTLADEASPDSLDLYVHRIRKKLAGSDVMIVTLRGLGYSLECSHAES
ncbi:two component transcriptional regulator, winged helix family [Dickeya chrysanthemi Ech1591]|uniref:Two component transcriptional regulator, winged helix family n=1 Tax=Dickeya chrysanthemi (strain Ech1591) TaxID=561229 RepID=C6CEB6_DICC1|nr:transcriptional regulator TctD [Dickeya chrysanthemi]ACT06226.1 two component transcriptional regulator, winged helix family [Dickeya chrysanthemi Ech1591]